MVLNVHRNHRAYQGRGEGGMKVGEEGGKEVWRGWWGGGGEGDYIPIATLSPPEW